MGWSKDPGPTYLAGRLPAVFSVRGIKRELSVFVDESGDFGEYEKHAPWEEEKAANMDVEWTGHQKLDVNLTIGGRFLI